jgi:hypothetical protein
MQKKSRDHWQPLGFFSRKLTDMESRYSTFESELLAAQAAIKHFHHFCEGRAFQLWTDHKPLVTAISCVSAPISPRQLHLVFTLEFNVQQLYLPSLKNVDFLSCPHQTTTGSVTATSVADPVDFEEMAAEQNHCPETQRLLGSTSLKLAFRQTGAQRQAGDVSTGNFCPIVPLKFRKTIFVLPNEFLQNDELSVDAIIKNFSRTLHVSAPSLPRHNSSTDLPSELLSTPLSGFVGAASFHPFSCSTTAPTPFCAVAQLLHHPGQVAGQGGRRQPL